MKKAAIIFDIDGTLADCTHRIHHIQGDKKNWDLFYSLMGADEEIEINCKMLRLFDLEGYHIILLTSRPEKWRNETIAWLGNNCLPFTSLFMRPNQCYQKDYDVKKEIYETQIASEYSVHAVFEDRTDVVKMWRELGLTCLQVQDGDY